MADAVKQPLPPIKEAITPKPIFLCYAGSSSIACTPARDRREARSWVALQLKFSFSERRPRTSASVARCLRLLQRPDRHLKTVFHRSSVFAFRQTFARPPDDHLCVSPQRGQIFRSMRGLRNHGDCFQQANGHRRARARILPYLVERRVDDFRERDRRNHNP